MATIPRRYVPLEIVDQIIASTPEPRTRELVASSLVCRQWYLLVRPRLFSTLKVRLNRDRKTIGHFAQFLAESQDITRCIRQIVLYAHQEQDGIDTPSISSGSLSMALQYLSALESLSLKNLRISHDGLPFVYTSSLQSLCLEGLSCVGMPHNGDLIDILSLFRSLGTLRIHSLDLVAYPDGSRHTPEDDSADDERYESSIELIADRMLTPLPLLTVGNLVIDRQDRTALFLHLMRRTGSISTLTEVFVHCTTSVDLALLAKLVSSAALRLQSITVQILWLNEPPWEANLNENLDIAITLFSQALSRCITLNSFTLYHWMDYSGSPVIPCRRIVSMVNSLPATLSNLRIDLDDEINDGWNLFDDTTWEALRTAVGQLVGLRKLELSADGMEGDGNMGEHCRMMVKQEMAKFDALGILRLPEHDVE